MLKWLDTYWVHLLTVTVVAAVVGTCSALIERADRKAVRSKTYSIWVPCGQKIVHTGSNRGTVNWSTRPMTKHDVPTVVTVHSAGHKDVTVLHECRK